MKLCSFRQRNDSTRSRIGLWTEAGVAEVSPAANGELSYTPEESGTWEALYASLDNGTVEDQNLGPNLPLEEVELLPPTPRPGKVIGVIGNYADALRLSGKPMPDRPVLFTKWSTSLIGTGAEIRIPRGVEDVTYEGELAVVIGRQARAIPAEKALEFVLGYTVMNDVTALRTRWDDGYVARGKNVDTFGPLGPYLVSRDEVENPDDLPVKVWVDGRLRQDSSTNQMIFSVSELIEFISRYTTLEAGDVIATGTPAGAANHHEPPAYLHPGQLVQVEVTGIGLLHNPVTAAPSSTATDH